MRKISVIAPANTMADLPVPLRSLGVARLRSHGFEVTFGRNVDARGRTCAAPLTQRLADLHAAIADPDVEMILPVFGGYNSNQLLPTVPYKELASSGKTVVGFSDITALLVSVDKFAGSPVIHGPSFSTLCDPGLFDYTLDCFLRTLRGETVTYSSPQAVADDAWYRKEGFGPREPRPFAGWRIHRAGRARGRLMGGNLETLLSLAGTRFFPETDECVLFLEDATGAHPEVFQRQMTQLRQMNVLQGIQGLMVGLMPRGTPLADSGLMDEILRDALEGTSYPVLCDVNCSHTDPAMSLRLGAQASLIADATPTLTMEATPVGLAARR